MFSSRSASSTQGRRRKAAAAFRRLPCVEDADLLENILYSGIWLKYHAKNRKKQPREP